jgi:hypothetical protein
VLAETEGEVVLCLKESLEDKSRGGLDMIFIRDPKNRQTCKLEVSFCPVGCPRPRCWDEERRHRCPILNGAVWLPWP